MKDFKHELIRHEELLELLEEYSDIVEDCPGSDLLTYVKGRLELLKLSDDFDIDFSNIRGYHYTNFKVNQHTRVIKGATVVCSDDGRQPDEDEYLYIIRFPAGVYTFGQHYPRELYGEFFRELKSYNPKYSDTTHSYLYFSKENARDIHKAFPEIYRKYESRVEEARKRLRKKELEDELRKLSEE